MIVTLDGERIELTRNAGPTLRDLIDAVRAEHAAGRIMASVTVNGRTLAGGELDAALAAAAPTQAQIDLESDHASAIVIAALCDLAERLEISGAAHAEVASRFSAGEVGRATRELGDLLSVWGDCHAVLSDAGALLGVDLTAVEVCGLTMTGHLEALAGKLRDVRDAVEARDYVHVSDLLEYELADVCRAWERICRELAKSVDRRVPDNAMQS